MIKAALCALCALLLCACGYAFAPKGEHIDARIQNIYVEPFRNKTAQAELENYVRTAFIDQVLQNSRFKAVASVEEANAVISGNVLHFTSSTLTHGDNNLSSSERAVLILEVSFRDLQTGKVLWSTREFKGLLDYPVDSDINVTMAIRKNYYTKLVKDTAENAFNLMMADF